MAALGGFVVFGSLVGAQPAALDRSAHLLVVPDTPEAEVALQRSDARVVARYGAFALVEASGSDDLELRRAGADRRDDMREVSLPGGELDPLSERESLAGKDAAEPQETLALVQFIGPVKDAWLARVRNTGARVVQYAAQNGYVVHAAGDEVGRLAGLVGTDPAVRAVTPLRAEDKLSEGLAAGPVAVQTVAGAEGGTARDEAAAGGRSIGAESEVAGLRTRVHLLSAGEIEALAEDPGVLAITPFAAPELLDERGAQIVAGNLAGGAPSGPGYLSWLAGKGFGTGPLGVTIDVTDAGLDNGSATAPGHPDFYETGVKPGTDRVGYAVNYTGDSSAADCGGHATNVASIAAGYGTTGAGTQDAGGFKYGLGVAPRVTLGASKIFNCANQFAPGASLTAITKNAYVAGADISNNSWGSPDNGSYSTLSREYDALVRDAEPSVPGNQGMVEVFAAGNEGAGGYGSVSSPGTAKNVITVGASENIRPTGGIDGCGGDDGIANGVADVIGLSGRGPTDDLRQKPDLVAPGTRVLGASPQTGSAYLGTRTCNKQFPAGNTLYSLITGTSQAAPHVAGAAALLRDWYRRVHGGGIATPSPALTKALLVNTATDIAGGDSGKGSVIGPAPNADQGWGRVALGSALDATQREYRDQSDLLSDSGNRFLRAYSVPNPGRPVKVTLAWTDAPGTVGADAFVNDLDLVVEGGGRTYKGNVLNGGISAPGGDADRRNNLESVVLPAGAVGRMSVRVIATGINGDGVPGNGDSTDQDFALVVSNAVEQEAPVLVVDTATITDSDLDPDPSLESGEPFGLDVRLRNAGDIPATGVTGTIAPGPGLSFSQNAASWSAMSPDETRVSSPRFAGELSPGVSCGTDVSATLSLTTNQGNDTVPLLLPTGQGDTPITRTQSHGGDGLAIPDGSTAGVVSTINVTEPGRVKDLNVRINAIRHTWVGDLVIELTSPDGTTVRLAEHPGGPDNNANDFGNTLFNDEAPENISSGSAPYPGAFRPQNDQLSRFDGKQQQGNWTLRVRDLFVSGAGTLGSWGTVTTPALCNFDTAAPATVLDSAPPARQTSSRDAEFTFHANEEGTGFLCSLDGAGFSGCSSPKRYSGLANGVHTFEVRAIDGSGNVDDDPPFAAHSWTVDVDDVPPDTSVASGPSGPTASRDASFSFASTEPGSAFLCSIDGAAAGACGAALNLNGLAEGAHTLAVQARDAAGNLDPSPAQRSWNVDTSTPVVSLRSPVAGATLSDPRPRLSGTAGTAASDSPSVTVKVWQGTLAAGLPRVTRVVPRDSVSGAWSERLPEALADGTWTARAEQADAVGHVGSTPAVTFEVDRSAAAAPDFALVPLESDLSDARAGRLAVIAGCGSACRITAELLPGKGRPSLLGRARASLSARGARALAPRLTRRGRAALAAARRVTGRLSVTLAGASRKLTLERAVVLRKVDLGRVARKGLPFAGSCSEACTMNASLKMPARDARRQGMKAKGTAPVKVAGGSARASAGGSRLVLRLSRPARRALAKVRSVTVAMEARVKGATGPQLRASRRLVLRG